MQNYRPTLGLTPAIKSILILNIIAYFVPMLLGAGIREYMYDMFSLHLPGSTHWKPWQYVTHLFIHASITHLFFNMFAVFMFGRILENIWGTQRFLIYYFVCGIGAGVLNSAIGWFEVQELMKQFAEFNANPTPTLFADVLKEQIASPHPDMWKFIDGWIDDPNSHMFIEHGKVLFQKIIDLKVNAAMVGASGAVFGILLAFGMLFPNTPLYLMFIPIPIKAKYFVIGYGLVEIYLGLQNNPGDNIAHFAHLGGMLFGFLLLRFWNRNRRQFY